MKPGAPLPHDRVITPQPHRADELPVSCGPTAVIESGATTGPASRTGVVTDACCEPVNSAITACHAWRPMGLAPECPPRPHGRVFRGWAARALRSNSLCLISSACRIFSIDKKSSGCMNIPVS